MFDVQVAAHHWRHALLLACCIMRLIVRKTRDFEAEFTSWVSASTCLRWAYDSSVRKAAASLRFSNRRRTFFMRLALDLRAWSAICCLSVALSRVRNATASMRFWHCCTTFFMSDVEDRCAWSASRRFSVTSTKLRHAAASRWFRSRATIRDTSCVVADARRLASSADTR